MVFAWLVASSFCGTGGDGVGGFPEVDARFVVESVLMSGNMLACAET